MKNLSYSLLIILLLNGCIKEAATNSNNSEMYSPYGTWEKNMSYCNDSELDTVIIDSLGIQYFSKCFTQTKYHFKFISSSMVEFQDTEFGWYYSKDTPILMQSSFKFISKDEFIVEKMVEDDHIHFDPNKRLSVRFRRIN